MDSIYKDLCFLWKESQKLLFIFGIVLNMVIIEYILFMEIKVEIKIRILIIESFLEIYIVFLQQM